MGGGGEVKFNLRLWLINLKSSCSFLYAPITHMAQTPSGKVCGSLVVWSVTPWGWQWATVGVSIGVSTQGHVSGLMLQLLNSQQTDSVCMDYEHMHLGTLQTGQPTN